VSDDILSIIATEPTWKPSSEQANEALSVLARLLPGIDVTIDNCRRIEFFDAGSNFIGVTCHRCNADVYRWWSGAIDVAADNDFVDLTATTPCCGESVSLNDLSYDWPAGFASFALRANNPGRSRLTSDEVDQLAAVLGRPLRQVMAHY
jgi:hypothetical protein